MPEASDPTFKEGAVEGRSDNWGEVVTRQPYRKVRLDHLLSKEEEVRVLYTVQVSRETQKDPGADALMGNTRSHPEHDG